MHTQTPGRPRGGRWQQLAAALVLWTAGSLSAGEVSAQALSEPPASAEEDGPSNVDATPGPVDVSPGAADADIRARLLRILRASGWFHEADVQVLEGIVILEGRAESEAHKRWAGDLARKTEDVVAVINRMELTRRPVWDFTPALEQLRSLLERIVSTMPGIGFAVLVLLATWLLARVVGRAVTWAARRRIETPLLRRVVARAAAFFVIVLGVYIVLYVSGLTRLAVTVLGGTGLIGLVVGVAFRDITENFLASIFLSVQHPFEVDDLVNIEGITGFVQRTTFRTTVLLTLDGNHVQVPNATVYKSVIQNFTSNPNRREHFDIGIGYSVAISRAQEIARAVLARHPAVLNDPEAWVLVHELGASTVVLRVYFWLDGTQHSWLKVRSSAIRLIKLAFQEAGIDMPDEAREVVFPRGVPIQLMQTAEGAAEPTVQESTSSQESREVATAAEAELGTEAGMLKRQGERSRLPEEGENLLR